MDQKSLARDMSLFRTQQRISTDFLEQFNRNERQGEIQRAEQAFTGLRRFVTRVQTQLTTMVRQLVQVVAAPVQQLGTLVRRGIQTLTQPLAQTAQMVQQGVQSAVRMANQAISNVLAFFFGGKKEKNIRDQEDKAQRDREDLGTEVLDAFQTTKVQASNETMMGSGSK